MSKHGDIFVVHFQIDDLMLGVIVVWWLWVPLESGPGLLLLVFFVYLTDMKLVQVSTTATSCPRLPRFQADSLPHGLLPLIFVDKAIQLEVEELLVGTQEVVSCASIDELQPIDLEDVLVILFGD